MICSIWGTADGPDTLTLGTDRPVACEGHILLLVLNVESWAEAVQYYDRYRDSFPVT
jgi:hypothetical protein